MINAQSIKYPVTATTEQTDDYFVTKIKDPYRWLENDTSEATKAWVKEENTVTHDYLSKIPFRDKIRNRLTELWNYPKYGAPSKEGEWFVFGKNDGLQNQAVLYVQKGLNGTPEVLLDPNKLSADGTVALQATAFSKKQQYFAYAVAASGSDWQEIYVMDFATKKVLNDKLEYVKFTGMSWAGDDGFYYSGYDKPADEKTKYSAKTEYQKVFYPSKDGTKVPMFITYKKGLKLDGNNPTLLYAYGGFNINLTPAFSVSNMVFIENGGVYCQANLRGGGEYGESWHKAGMLDKKQNVFDDFIAAAEYLIREKYTSSQKLAIRGGSNGGLLIGACLTQRPDLFKVAIPQVGVLDMLRYHKFTVGWGWAVEYGSSDKKEQFDYLIKYSPLHNIKKGACYPATLITTADHDDRVVPAHSFKFSATLQPAQGCDNPVLIRIDSKAGHGAGKPTSKIIDEAADIWSFVLYNMGVNL